MKKRKKKEYLEKSPKNREADKPAEADREKTPPKSRLRENTEAIVIAVILALFIRTFIIQAFKIPSGSMLETLQIGDHILVNKFIYGVKLPFIQKTVIPVKEPKPGDIVVFRYPKDPSKDYIKRVIAVEGQTIEIKDKVVYVNGRPLAEDYTKYEDDSTYERSLTLRDNFGPVKVPEDALFVMGDNRDNSLDSRFWGFVPLDEVKGKALIVYFSCVMPWEISWPWKWDWERFDIKWSRFGKLIH